MRKRKIFGKFSELTISLYGVDFVFSGTCIGHLEDEGIGPYEFWGQLGTHHQWVEYIDEWTPEMLLLCIDLKVHPSYKIGDLDELNLDYPIDKLKVEQPKLWGEIEDHIFNGDVSGIEWEEDAEYGID